MRVEEDNFADAAESILKAVIFENWLRFHFMVEKAGETPRIEVPAKNLEKIKNLYGPFLNLAQELNQEEISFAKSRQAICDYILNHLQERGLPAEKGAEILSSSVFQTNLELFHAWVELHSSQLETGFLEFALWLELFEQWRVSPHARELLQKLNSGK